MTAATTWWDGFRNSHKALLRAVPMIAVAIAFVVFVIPESATLGPVVESICQPRDQLAVTEVEPDLALLRP